MRYRHISQYSVLVTKTTGIVGRQLDKSLAYPEENNVPIWMLMHPWIV